MSTEGKRVWGPKLLTAVPKEIDIPGYRSVFRECLEITDTIIYESPRVTVSKATEADKEIYSVFDAATHLLNYVGVYGKDASGRMAIEEAAVLTYDVFPDEDIAPGVDFPAIVSVEEILLKKEKKDGSWIQQFTLGALRINRPEELDELDDSDYQDLIEGEFDSADYYAIPLNTEGVTLLQTVNKQLSRVPGNEHFRSAKLPNH